MSNIIKEEKEQIISWIKEQFNTANKRKAVIAVTNENSFVAIELLSKALDPKDVIAVYFGSPGTIPPFLTTLGVTSFLFQQGDILLEGFKKRLPQPTTLDSHTNHWLKNTEARIQMTVLYGLANMLENALVVGSLDKTQSERGDFVKYGNVADIELLKRFYETDILEYLNELNLTPTKHLSELTSVEKALKTILDGNELPKDYSKEEFNNILKQMRETEHKRITSPFYGEMD